MFRCEPDLEALGILQVKALEIKKVQPCSLVAAENVLLKNIDSPITQHYSHGQANAEIIGKKKKNFPIIMTSCKTEFKPNLVLGKTLQVLSSVEVSHYINQTGANCVKSSSAAHSRACLLLQQVAG